MSAPEEPMPTNDEVQDLPLAQSVVVDAIATVRFGSPPLNILDYSAFEAIARELQVLNSRDDLRLLVLQGWGQKAFSAGAAVEDHVAQRVEGMLKRFHQLVDVLRSFRCPTLAVVDGHCLGGGLELAMSCDFIAATQQSHFGQPEVKLGCFPPIAAALLPNRNGYGRALELLLTGRTVHYEEAVELGWVHFPLESGSLFESSRDQLIANLTSHSAAVAKLIKRAVGRSTGLDFATAVQDAETLYLEELVGTKDMNEGIAAFLERRQPRWQHR